MTDLNAEDKVLSYLLHKPFDFSIVSPLIGSVDVFTVKENKTLYEAILEANTKDMLTDSISIFFHCEKTINKADFPRFKDRFSVIMATHYPDAIETFCLILRQNHIARNLAELATTLTNQIVNHSDVFEIIDFGRKEIERISSIGEILVSKPFGYYVDMTQKQFHNAGNVGADFVPSGIPILDSYLNGGFYAGCVYTIGARPGQGKTAFCCQIAHNMSVVNAHKTAFISIEMTAQQVSNRIISIETGVTNSQLTSLKQEIIGTVMKLDDEFKASPIEIIEDVYDFSQLCLKIPELVKKGCKVFFIDYLQLLVKDENKATSEIQQITKILKRMAKRYEIAIVDICQLSRQVEQRADKRPILSDLKQSGSIEQDSDTVIFLYRPSYYQDETATVYDNQTMTDLDVGIYKNRNGRIATWDRPIGLQYDLANNRITEKDFYQTKKASF